MNDIAGILRCPSSHESLSFDSARQRLVAPGGAAYAYEAGVGRFLAPVAANDGNLSTRNFYDDGGWSADASGLYDDTKRFVDTRPTPMRFTRACITRLRKYFSKGGRYLLDVGSGPIPHDELLAYSNRYAKRVCVDLSVPALREAHRKLGDRGAYLQGDLTNLPIQTGVIDAAMCFHVIYQLPHDQQATAFRELWRVLKPGGTAVIVYWWANPKLPDQVQRIADTLRRQTNDAAPQSASVMTDLPDHNPHSLEWFTSQDWPFSYKFDTYRIVGNSFLNSVPDDWRGALFLGALMSFQRLAPEYCGKHGLMPAIVVRKPTS